MLRRASDGSHDTDNADHMTQEQDDDRTANNQDGHPPPNNSKKDSNMEILVMQFLKNSIVNNPIVVSNVHCARLYRIYSDFKLAICWISFQLSGSLL